MTLLAGLAAALAVLCWTGTASRWVSERRLARVGVVEGQVSRQRLPRTRPAQRGRRRLEVVELADALAGELAAGAGWEAALQRAAAGTGGELGHRLCAAADVQAGLEAAGLLPGAQGLRALAAVLALVRQLGAAGAQLVERLADALRAQDATLRAVEVELAPALATTRLLAGLPALGLLLGVALGADPVHVLLETRAGWLCLAAAGLLEALGLLWCRAIRRRAVG